VTASRGSGGAGGVHTKAVGSDSPPAFDDESLRAMHAAVVSRQSLQVKAFASPDSLLPAQLAPQVLGPVHEGRLLERLPIQAIDRVGLRVHQAQLDDRRGRGGRRGRPQA
jgi:hypothetical protein